MKRLRHPNILLFMGAVMSPERLGIVTEFLPRYPLFMLTLPFCRNLYFSNPELSDMSLRVPFFQIFNSLSRSASIQILQFAIRRVTCVLIPLFHFVQWKSVPAIAEEYIKIRIKKVYSHGFGHSKLSFKFY